MKMLVMHIWMCEFFYSFLATVTNIQGGADKSIA